MSPFQTQPADEPLGDAQRARPTEAALTDAPPANPGVWFEPTDISLRGVLVVLSVAACVLPLIGLLVLSLFLGEERRQGELKASSIPRESQTSGGLPAQPRLEQLDRLAGLETSDIYLREAADQAKLNSYGQTDEPGFVHVPIDWAIRQAAEQLPVSKENGRPQDSSAKPVKDQDLLDSGQSNSGQVLQGQSP